MEKVYTDPSNPGSFTGLNTFTRALREKNIKATKSEIKKFLDNKESYSLHRPKRLNYPRKRVIVNGIDDTWQIDLVDVTPLQKENDGNKFILTAIDVFSKKGWASELKNKEKLNVKNAFEKFLVSRKPKKIQCDKGSEFYNSVFQKLLKDNNIRMYSTDSDLKASVVERFNRTLKEKMWRYFTFSGTKKWINVLPQLIKSYNNTYHRSIKRKPNQVNKKDQDEIFMTLYNYSKSDGNHSNIKINFKVDDFVRLSKIKKTFEKGYTPNWTREIFKIDKIKATVPVSYKIKDLNNEELTGSFYEQELQKIENFDETFDIDQIIKTKVVNKKTQYFVSWKGYPASFNSWVPKESIILK